MCGCVKIYTHKGFSTQPSLMMLTFKSKSDERGTGNRLYISFTYTHAHTLIKKARESICAQIAMWCMLSFILCTRIIKLENPLTFCPLTPCVHTQKTPQREMLCRSMFEKSRLAASVNSAAWLRSRLCVCSLSVTPQHTPAHMLAQRDTQCVLTPVIIGLC